MAEPNKDVLRLWVEDLETTTDRQGKGCLARVSKEYIGVEPSIEYCCLGRLSKLAVEHGVIPEPELVNDLSDQVYQYGDPTIPGNDDEGRDLSTLVLPDAVMEWAGLEENDPVLDVNLEDEADLRAADLNDTYNLTFPEIAEKIRAKFDL